MCLEFVHQQGVWTLGKELVPGFLIEHRDFVHLPGNLFSVQGPACLSSKQGGTAVQAVPEWMWSGPSLKGFYCCCLVTKSCLTLCNPRLCCPRDFPGKNPGVACHHLLQEELLNWTKSQCVPLPNTHIITKVMEGYEELQVHPMISNMQPKDRGKRRLGQWHYFPELVFTRTLILFQAWFLNFQCQNHMKVFA